VLVGLERIEGAPQGRHVPPKHQASVAGRQMIWIAILVITIAIAWGDPQPASSSTRHLSLQSLGLNDADDDNAANDMPLGGAGYIKIASSQSCVNTIEHLTAACDTALGDLSHGSRSPPRAPADLIYRVVLLSILTVVDRSAVCSASSFLGRSSLDRLCRPPLSCHCFQAGEVRFLLSVSTYPW